MFVAVIVCGVAADGAAQNIRPSRALSRSVWRRRSSRIGRNSSRIWLLTASILGGYDDYLAPQSSAGPVDPALELQGGYSALADLGSRDIRHGRNGSCVID